LLLQEWRPETEVFTDRCKERDKASVYNWDSDIIKQKLIDIELLTTLRFDGFIGFESMFSIKHICHEFFTERGWSDEEAAAKLAEIEEKRSRVVKPKFLVFYDAKKDKYIYELKDKKRFRPNIKDDQTRQLQKFYRFRENETVTTENKEFNDPKPEEKKTKRKRNKNKKKK